MKRSGMKNEITLAKEKFAVVLKTRSPKEAADFFEVIVSTKNDHFGKELLRGVPALNLAGILREFDVSSPTIISGLVFPEQVAQIFEVEPLYWSIGVFPEFLEKECLVIREGAKTLIFSLLGWENDDRRAEILQAVVSNKAALNYLALPFIISDKDNDNSKDVIDEEEEDVPGLFCWDRADLVDGSLEDLWDIIQRASPEAAEKITRLIERGNGKKITLLGYIRRLRRDALKRVKRPKKLVEAFEPLNL